MSDTKTRRLSPLALIALILAVIACGLSVYNFVQGLNQPPAPAPAEEAGDVQYALYLGTNDKDTNELVFPKEECVERAKKILISRFGGYTIQEASGGWIGDDGKVYQEYTLIIYLSGTTLDQVHAAADELIREFNQSSVLIQGDVTTTEFYSGAQ